MKKIVLSSVLFTAIALMFAGCLKDEGFENHEYGINDPDLSPPGVGFALAGKPFGKNTIGIDLSTSPQVVNNIIFVKLFAGKKAAADVHITLTLNNALVTAYNAANGTNIQILPASMYSIPTLDLVIPAGQEFVTVPITIPNTSTLDPNLSYAIGLTITSVDGGYQIAENLKNLILEFTVKNKYDGRYQLRGFHNRTTPLLNAPYDEEVHMITTGPASVAMWWPALGDYAHPLHGGTTYYGSMTANFIFNSNNDLVAWDWTPWPTSFPTAMGPATNNRWDPITRTIYAQFYYNNNPTQRGFTDTLFYLGPR